jgi:hypothetical protein
LRRSGSLSRRGHRARGQDEADGGKFGENVVEICGIAHGFYFVLTVI